MERYIVDGFANDNLIETMSESSCKRLIQELNFKYGMKVLTTLQAPEIYKQRPIEFLMTESTGAFPVARVYTDLDCGEIVYNYRSPYYRKDRGSDSADRETIHSKKLSTLMGTLKRQDVVRDLPYVFRDKIKNNLSAGVTQLESSFGNDYKRNALDIEDIHDLLRAVVREIPNTLDIEKCKKELDKLDEVDRIKAKRREEVERFFHKEFYAVGADSLNHLVIGTVKRDIVNNDKEVFEILQPFKRVADLNEHEHLKPIMLMNKIYYENKDHSKFYANFIPQVSGYVNDLDVVNISTNRVDEFNLAWTLIPCSTI